MEARTYLEIDDNQDDNHSCNQIADVWRVLSVEGLLECIEWVLLGQEEVEQGDNGALKLSTLLCSDRNGREALPEDDLTDVGSDEEGDSGAETIAFLEELVKQDHDDT